jgi:hypothetical protein
MTVALFSPVTLAEIVHKCITRSLKIGGPTTEAVGPC